MTNVRYQATGVLPAGVPAAVVAQPGEVTILIAEHLSIEEACAVLGPLITAHAADCWHPGQRIA